MTLGPGHPVARDQVVKPSDDEGHGDGVPRCGGRGVGPCRRTRRTSWVLVKMRQDVAWHRRTGFFIEPPLVIEDERAVVEHQDMRVFLRLGSSRREHAWIRVRDAGDVHQMRDGRLPRPPLRGSRRIRTTSRRRRQVAERSQWCGATRRRRPSAQRILFDATAGRGQQPRRRCRVSVRRPTASQPDLTTSHEPRQKSPAWRSPQERNAGPCFAWTMVPTR
jgi:hypothetical protein